MLSPKTMDAGEAETHMSRIKTELKTLVSFKIYGNASIAAKREHHMLRDYHKKPPYWAIYGLADTGFIDGIGGYGILVERYFISI